MIFRLSQNLSTKIKSGPLAACPPDDNPFTDWSVRLFTAGRLQYILISNTTTLYSAVMFGRGVTDANTLLQQSLRSIREQMSADRLSDAYDRFVAPGSATVQLCKALNRSVTGSMNEQVDLAQILLIEQDLSPYDVSRRLNDFLISAAGRDIGQSYDRPLAAFNRMTRNCEQAQ